MAVHIVTPQQTQTGTFAVVVWIIGGDARSSVASPRLRRNSIASNLPAVPVDVVMIASTIESGQTRVIVAVTPPTGYRDSITLLVPQNAFSIGSYPLAKRASGYHVCAYRF